MPLDEFESMYNRQVSILKQCKTSMEDNSLTSICTDIVRLKKELSECHLQFIRSRIIVDDLPPASHNDNIEELLEDVVSKSQKADDRADEVETDEFTDEEVTPGNILDESLGDRSFLMSQPDGIPIDPITQQAIRVPARNVVCNHVYEHDVITSYLKPRRNRKPIKCPHIGCSNTKLLLADIVQDVQLQQEIADKMKNQRRSKNHRGSIVAID